MVLDPERQFYSYNELIVKGYQKGYLGQNREIRKKIFYRSHVTQDKYNKL